MRKKFINNVDKMFLNIDRENIWKNQNKKCFYCSKTLSKSEITLDHVVPLKKTNRLHSIQNCVVACLSCNQHKGCDENFEPVVETPEAWEIQLQNGLDRLDHLTKKSMYSIVRYSGCEDHKGSFSKWLSFWEKRQRF
jgi:CRISPR/Cas system Type II protein with McrA/HNH and RuvC-like nuclease domain